MNNRRRGAALVINNITFSDRKSNQTHIENLETCQGAEVDSEKTSKEY